MHFGLNRLTKFLALVFLSLPSLLNAADAPVPATPPKPPAKPLVLQVQVLVPGITVRELPVDLTNINNVCYAPDGRLFAAGYDGRVHLLRDTDGDGLEDAVTTFSNKVSSDFPMGIAFQNGKLYVQRRNELIAHVDSDNDGIPDREEVAATGWREEELDKDPLYQHRRVDDAIGLAIAPDGTIYTSTGSPNYSNGFLLDKSGASHFDLKRRRGTVLRIRPGGKPEIMATGVRFLVSMQLNKYGDLFATDQEGATWLPNGNPFDELLQIQEGRHYGFPPSHPKHLNSVVDEPSVFDYAPQHESTCGFRFNTPNQGEKAFGPAEWADDAFVTGESRGKLYRTKVVKTEQGYVAQNQLIAYMNVLPVDLAFSPKGEMLIAAHTGAPDWGSGPGGKGKLFKLVYSRPDSPVPVATYAMSPTQTRIEFNQPIPMSARESLQREIKMQSGKYLTAGERFEAFQPGYAVVKNIQRKQPRTELTVLNTKLSDDGRSLTLTHAPRTEGLSYSISKSGATDAAANLELAHELSGLEASWKSADGQTQWSGWLPHTNLAVSEELTRGSSEHARLFSLLKQPGTLHLKTQLDLWQMLHPAVQPGSKLDYEPTLETVTLTIQGSGKVELTASGPVEVTRVSETEVRLQTTSRLAWTPVEISMSTGQPEPKLNCYWHTQEDARERTMMLRRFVLPWAIPAKSVNMETRSAPEIAGGNWDAGKALFFGKNPGCANCHTKDGEGGKIGPDLSNVIHRDYESVMKDVLQPSATINPDYLNYLIKLKSGKVVAGVVVSANDQEIRLGDAGGQFQPILKTEIATMVASKQSLMPEELLKALTPDEIKNLMTYLLTERPATPVK